MKRSAENQLTKDSREDDDELVEDGTGFKAASQEAMAGRKIKGLPKRRTAGAMPGPSASSEFEAPKAVFGSFSGFGSIPAANSNGTSDSTAAKPSLFSGFGGFGASTAAAPSSATPTPPSSLFGTSTGAPSKTSQLFGASIAAASSSSLQTNGTGSASAFGFKLPTVSSTISPSTSSTAQTTSTFAFGGPPSTSSAAAPKSTSLPSSSPTSSDKSVEYFLSLRGLNNSLLAAIESTIAKDPFAKLPIKTIAAAYAKHWGDIEAKAKAATSTDVEMKGTPAEQAKPTSTSTTTSSAPTPPSFAMPKPPTGGFSFGAAGATSAPSTTMPSFNFGAKPSESSSADKSISGPPSFAFKPPGGGFTFGSQITTAPSLFGAKTDSEAGSTATQSSMFGGNMLFGAPKPKEAESDSKNADDKEATPSDSSVPKPSLYPFSALDSKSPTPTPAGPKPNPPTFFSFGSTPATTPTQTPGTPDPAEKKPAFSFGFGGGKANSFSFGVATPGISTPSSGSLGNPVGFSFGAPSATGAVTPTPATTAGLEAAKAAHDPNSRPEGSTVSVISETPADSPAPVSESADIVGAGEENEDTLISERGKAYKLKDGSWTDIGTGYFKIKKDKDTGMRRVLMRPEHGGNIILNFRFHPDLNPRPGQKPVNLTLVAIENGKPLNIVMRFTNGDATQRVLSKLKEVLETH